MPTSKIENLVLWDRKITGGDMKIGRNAPCPCGSGKKYKKCCLDKNITPPEALNYRRLSKALDELMPKLIDHGFTVFGHAVYGLAWLNG